MTPVVLDTEAFFGLIHGPGEIFTVGTIDPSRWSAVRSAKAGAERAIMLDQSGARGVHFSVACLLDIPTGGARGGADLVRGSRVVWADLDLSLLHFYPRGRDFLTDAEKALAVQALVVRTGKKIEELNERQIENEILREANAPERLGDDELDEGIALILSALDKCVSTGLVPPPTIVVRSGQGIQCYWLLDLLYEGERNIWLIRETCEGVARRLIDAGADSQVAEITRCLRVPGTTHRKVQERPLSCCILRQGDTRYILEDLARAISVDPDGAIKRSSSNGTSGLSIERLLAIASGTEAVPPEMGHAALLDIARELRNDGADEIVISEAIGLVRTSTEKSEAERKNIVKWAMQLEKARGTGRMAKAVSSLIGRPAVNIIDPFTLAKDAALTLIKECEESGTRIDPITLSENSGGAKLLSLLIDVEHNEREIILRTVAKAGVGLRLKDIQTVLRSFSKHEDHATISASIDTPYPFISDCEVPEGWSMRRDGGISRTGKDTVALACGEPILPIKVLVDPETSEEQIRCAFRTDGTWRETEAPRASWIDTKSLIQLANRGVPVIGSATTHLSDWIEAFARKNQGRIPRSISAARCGWIGDNWEAFSLGSRCLGKEIEGRSAQGELAAALRTSGSFEKWKEGCELWQGHPAPSVALAASLLSPFLHPLGTGAFVMTLGGQTSQGKTTVLQTAASVWGFGGDTEGRGLIMGLDMTRLAASGYAAWLRHLPAFFDEGQRFDRGGKGETEEIIYSLANGQPRIRCRRDGTPIPSPSWCSVAVLAGERDWGGEARHGGFLARSLALPWPPFPPESGSLVRHLKSWASENHGHLGPALIERVLNIGVSKFCGSLAARMREITKEWLAVDGTPVITQRTARLYALIAAIGETVLNFGLVPGKWPILKYAHEVWGNSGIEEIVTGDPSAEALRVLLDLPGRFPGAFSQKVGIRIIEPKQPNVERMGRVDYDVNSVPQEGEEEPDFRVCTQVCISVSTARKVLLEHGFDSRFNYAIWDRAKLLIPAKGQRTPLVRIGDQAMRCLVFSGDALRERGLI